jgi:hypothetical protein
MIADDGNSDVEEVKANTSKVPYETPVILRTKPWAPSEVQDDTDVEDSEIERLVSKFQKKVTKVSSGSDLNAVDD